MSNKNSQKFAQGKKKKKGRDLRLEFIVIDDNGISFTSKERYRFKKENK
jgi:hypothetical protein